MILFVSYDLKSARDYTQFYEALKQQGAWWHYLASTWLLSTGKTPQEVVDAVHPYIDSQDMLLVAEMGERYQGYLPTPAWEWINQQRAPKTVNVFTTLAGGIPPPPAQYGTLSNLLTGKIPPAESEPNSLLKKALSSLGEIPPARKK